MGKEALNIGQELVIGGFSPGNHGIDALVVGFYRGDALMYAARVRAGLVPATRRELYSRLKPLIIGECPFANLPELQSGRWGQGLTATKMKDCIWGGKIGLWLRGLFEVAASYAWRKSEAAVNLRVSQIDLSNRTIDLNPGETKNRGGTTVKMTERVYQIIAVCVEDKAPDDSVFTRADGSLPGDFRKACA